MKKIAALLAVFAALSACETTKGIGKDLSKAGDAVTNAASDVQKSF